MYLQNQLLQKLFLVEVSGLLWL